MTSKLMEDLDVVVKERERLTIENGLLRKALEELQAKYTELERYNNIILAISDNYK